MKKKIFVTICICSVLLPVSARQKKVVCETTMGRIEFLLYEETPKHKKNFIRLAETHFFDSLLFHRVIEGFVVQGGDPTSKNAAPGVLLGETDAGYTIPAEIRTRWDIRHKRGTVMAAREPDEVNPEMESSSSQFCFMVNDAPHLDDHYTVFGEVISGMEVVDAIQRVPTDANDRPLEDVRMLRVWVEDMKKR